MRVQRVVMPVTGAESWTVVDDGWAPVEPVERYLAHLAGIERSPNTLRATRMVPRLWFEFLGAPIPLCRLVDTTPRRALPRVWAKRTGRTRRSGRATPARAYSVYTALCRNHR